jgi:hypothetical protein
MTHSYNVEQLIKMMQTYKRYKQLIKMMQTYKRYK